MIYNYIKKIASEVFSRYNGDKNSFELFTLRTLIDNINNERVKNKKDTQEEIKNVKKNVKSEALKEIVKDLELAIFGDDDNDESLIEGLDEDILEEEKLDRGFKNLISKKCRESLKEYLKESKDANPQDRVNALKEYLKESKDANPQDRVKELKKNLNNLFKKISGDDDDSKDNDNDDSEDNQINNFVDEVLKKVSKKIVNDDAKNVSKKIVNDDAKKVSKEIVNDDAKKKEIKEILELDKKYMESRAKTDKTIEELNAELKDREEVNKKADEVLQENYAHNAQMPSEEIEKYNKIINDNLDMSSEKSEIINKLIESHNLIKIYNMNKIDNNLEANENINNISRRKDIRKLEKRLKELSKKGMGVFTSKKEFAKLLTFLAQLLTNNTAGPTAKYSALVRSSKKLISNIEQLINNLYDNKQITKKVYNMLNKSITYK